MLHVSTKMVTFSFLRALLVLMFMVELFPLLLPNISWEWPLLVLYRGNHFPLYFRYLSLLNHVVIDANGLIE
jgi:hypothetical protein